MSKNKTNLTELVQNLVQLGKESVYWDFKLKHHDHAHKLLHDVICLANAEHDGDRFLIFGVSNDANVIGTLGTKPRRTQADIMDIFRANQNKFAGSRYPDIQLEKIEIGDLEIDVLIIKDTPHKPYYLIEKIRDLAPHHIYSRVLDTNIPANKSATPHDIERMWRERFGLNLSPLRRAQVYLSDFDSWKSGAQDNGNTLWFHKVFPEFTIRVEDSDLASSEEWTQGEIVKNNNFSCLYDIYYHQTRMARILWVSFDDRKKSMVAPKWEPCSAGRFYYYDRDSIEFAMQLFHAHHNGGDHSKTLRANSGFIEIPVAFENEVNQFLSAQSNHTSFEVCCDPAEQYRIFLSNQSNFLKLQRNGNRTE